MVISSFDILIRTRRKSQPRISAEQGGSARVIVPVVFTSHLADGIGPRGREASNR